MEKNLIRKGNLVWHIGLGFSEILEIRNDGISICSPKQRSQAMFEPNSNLHRIEDAPLTIDEIKRLGFSNVGYKQENYYGIDIKPEKGMHYDIVFEYENGIFEFHFEHSGICLTNSFDSIRDLQNWFFFNIGYELTYSLAAVA